MKEVLRHLLLVTIIGAGPDASLSNSGMAQSAVSETTQQVEERVLSTLAVAVKNQISKLPRASKSQTKRANEISGWYKARDYEPIWITGKQVSEKAEKTIYKLLTAYEDGLIPSDYKASRLFSLAAVQSTEQQAAFEIALSQRL